MAAHVNPAYYQHTAHPSGHMTVHVNPAYFQAGYLHHTSAIAHAGRGSGGGRHSTKHKKGVTIQHRHHSPMPTMHDPFKHSGMGKIR